jgi:hypothetical protein
MITTSDMIAIAISLIALSFVWYLTRRDSAETPDTPQPATLCECGRKDSKIPYFQRKWTPLADFLQRKLKGMSKLKLLIQLGERQAAKGDKIGALMTNEDIHEEIDRIQKKVNKRWMLCRLCWHVVRRHSVTREIEDRCCFQRNRVTPLLTEEITFFDYASPGEYLRQNQEEEE